MNVYVLAHDDGLVLIDSGWAVAETRSAHACPTALELTRHLEAGRFAIPRPGGPGRSQHVLADLERWSGLAVKLMLKWPGLSCMTSSYAPRHYPREIIDFANTRGAEKVMYAGYFPMALSLERIFRELPGVPFRAAVWPKFLRENAARIFNIRVG